MRVDGEMSWQVGQSIGGGGILLPVRWAIRINVPLALHAVCSCQVLATVTGTAAKKKHLSSVGGGWHWFMRLTALFVSMTASPATPLFLCSVRGLGTTSVSAPRACQGRRSGASARAAT